MNRLIELVCCYVCEVFVNILWLCLRLVDIRLPESVEQYVSEALAVGAPLLLPPLQERMELLHSLLPQGPEKWDAMSRGEVIITQIVP